MFGSAIPWRSGLEADVWELWAAAESTGVSESTQRGKGAGEESLTFKRGPQRREEEPVKSPEKEWAEG